MKRIWAIGASVRALAQSLIALGYEVIAADLFNDLDLQRIAPTQRIVDFPHDLLQLVDAVEADAFVYTGGLENYPDLIDTLAKRLPLLGNPGSVLCKVRDVTTLEKALQQGGFRMPPMLPVIPQDQRQRWLRKSADSAGGLRVTRATRHHRPLRSGEYCQLFVEGPVYGASFTCDDRKVQWLGVARQLTSCRWTGAPRYQYAGSIGPLQLSDSLQDEVERLGKYLAGEFGLRGWFGVDAIVDAEGQLWVLEVNPRYTASMELLGGTGFSGKAILYAKRRMLVTPEFVQRLLDRGDVADIPCAGSEIPAESPVLTLLAQEATEAETYTRLQEQALELQREWSKQKQ